MDNISLLLEGFATALQPQYLLFAFLGAWGDFLGALTFLTRQELFTLPVAVENVASGAFGTVMEKYSTLRTASAISPSCSGLVMTLEALLTHLPSRVERVRQ